MVNISIYNNRLLDYLIFLGVVLVGLALVKLIRSLILKTLKQWAKKSTSPLDDFLIPALEKALIPGFYYGIFYLSLVHLLVLPDFIGKTGHILGILLMTFLGIRFLSAFIVHLVKTYWLEKSELAGGKSFKGIIPAIQVLIWGAGSIFLLDNLGFQVSAMLAGLGIGGIAVAVGSQAILGDLFSYFSILFDRPFEIGDFIIVGEYMGVVEHIGIKTTRISSLSGEQLIFSNSDLTSSRVRNYMKMTTRRADFKIGVTYETSFPLVKEIPVIIKEIITHVENTTFDRAHFVSYGDFSLIYEIVYYIHTADYNIYMDIQQEINLRIMEEFKSRGIQFAYPTRTLYMASPEKQE
ncbi:MAG TPA: mechanosensitive ion channel family protein [Spirochaetes bacterium]|nr:mechanosensitive ion channel family protein [Spirochaetota bacterium]